MESGLGSTSFREAGTHAGRGDALSCGQPIPIAPDSLLPSRAPVLLGLLSLFICLGVHSSGVTFLLESPLSGTVEGPGQGLVRYLMHGDMLTLKKQSSCVP